MHYVPYLEGRFHTASPDSQGVPSGAILQFLTELDRLDVDLHSLYIDNTILKQSISRI